jgi:hypothetical protein
MWQQQALLLLLLLLLLVVVTGCLQGTPLSAHCMRLRQLQLLLLCLAHRH